MSGSQAGRFEWIAEHAALTNAAGLVDLGHRTRIELAGADRAAFLHNLCTNEVRKLAVGAGCEAFLTSVQGKTLGHVIIFAGPETLIIDTVPGQSESLLKHLDHYLVCEQVTLADRSLESSAMLLAGPQADDVLGRLAETRLDPGRLVHVQATLHGKNAWLARVDWTGGDGVLINVAGDDLQAVRTRLLGAGAVACGETAFDAARIEAGFPWFGRDISPNNLPQEIARDSQAISFVKGCYLGQETVARIDALGHVNKSLVGIRFQGPEIPVPGAELSAGGQSVGQITSATFSPRLATTLALGFVRRGSNTPGTQLSSAVGDAEVVSLPIR